VVDPAVAPPRRASSFAFLRWAGLAGIVYVVLFVVGLIVLMNGLPDTDAPPAEVIRYYQESSNRDHIHIGYLLILIGVFFLIWFLGTLREVVRRLAGDGLLTAVTTVGGAVYAATTLVGFSLDEAIYTMSDDTYNHAVYPGLIHAANDAGYVIHSAGGVGLGAAIVAVSLAALGARALPAWLGWLSVLAGVVVVFSIFFFPWFVIALWLVVASVLVTRALGRPGPAPVA
jgi:hypothetical protein